MLLANLDSKPLARVIALTLAAVGFTCAVGRPTASADEKLTPKGAESVKDTLTPESVPHVLALLRPQENEWRHLKVEWLTDVVAARKRAAAEDKPIIICYTGGAGYNEPLGVC